MARRVKQQRPVDAAVADWTEPDQVWEQRSSGPARLHLVELAYLRVAVAVGGVGELDGNEGLRLGLVVARAVVEQLVHELASNHAGKEVIDDQPLVVPAQGATSLREELSL